MNGPTTVTLPELTPAGLRFAADQIESGATSSTASKSIFDLVFASGKDYPTVYEANKPQQVSDTEIEKFVDEAIAANPKQVEQYRGGKTTVIAFFVGQVMKASKGSANPGLINDLLKKKLG